MVRVRGRLLAAAARGAVALCLVTPAVVLGQDGGSGKELFGRYCVTCHGSDGTGDGVISGFLKTEPADLTQLSKKNGGEFPFHRTVRFIDGTQDVRAHGDPAMPVWGEVFRAESAASPTRQAEIREKILEITIYVRSIQE